NRPHRADKRMVRVIGPRPYSGRCKNTVRAVPGISPRRVVVVPAISHGVRRVIAVRWPPLMAKVFVVDDDADSREALVAYLNKGGHSARGIAGGRQAMEAISADVPDAI